MADAKLTALPTVTSLADADLLYAVASTASSAISMSNLATDVSGRLEFDNMNAFAAREEQTAGTDGGTFTAGSWEDRTLNTIEERTAAYVTLSSNVLNIPAGTWLLLWTAPGLQVVLHQSRIVVNHAGTPEYHYGTSCRSGGASNVTSLSLGLAIITQASPWTAKLQHKCSSTQATRGLGEATSMGTEVYSQVFGIRISA